MKTLNYLIVIFIGLLSSVSATFSSVSKPHILELNERVLCVDDGLILGNGDLSVSVYQTVDRIIWRFGKGDVWDRRLDLSDNPRPLTIDELAHGIKVEGWKCGPYGGPVEAIHGTENPKRMQEVCQGTPASEKNRPYPCPKPVGELVMQLPPDHMNMKITQRLIIEEGRLEILCSWQSGVKLTVNCFIPPSPNVLVVNWKLENWNKETQTGNKPPVWFWLHRWADPDLKEYGVRFDADFMHQYAKTYWDPKVTPLSPPSVRQIENLYVIEQTFGKDPLFTDGFYYWAVPFVPGAKIAPVDMSPSKEARIRILPPNEMSEGWLAIAVPTSSDKGGVLSEFQRLKNLLADNTITTLSNWLEETKISAQEFWSKSSITIDDSFLENLWYETLHVRRAAYRFDTVPPGLFLPSTINDFSHWHGDYHTNYNIQEPFWGDYTANHFEIGDAYFKVMEFFQQIGRKIARDYYNCRGVFIQLTGFPIYAEDDYLGIAPMGRMAYMTGWAMSQYWWRYLYSKDKNWLREVGYPFIKDCALFYTDFLKKGDDGLYHAFPSNQGEDGFSGDPKDYTDRPQVMQHVRYCLRSAIKAAEEINMDFDLRMQWQDILDHLAPDDGKSVPQLEGIEKMRAELNPPEFGHVFRRITAQPININAPSPLAEKGYNWTWYFGQYPWRIMTMLREGSFIADRDFDEFRKIIERWRHPNGLIWGMSIANYGHTGVWTESLGVIAPLQEMLLQSWDGALNIFPNLPSNRSASFRDLRAEGAFLVSAEKKGQDITYVKIKSLAGSPLQIYNPYSATEQVRIFDSTSEKIVIEGKFAKLDIIKINTETDHEYLMDKKSM
ncbi:MAG: hypothetical protein M1426_00675 [Patescibacteria group bacterium]|nr:hypothetical protein [Patescibacteria group bacterium]